MRRRCLHGNWWQHGRDANRLTGCMRGKWNLGFAAIRLRGDLLRGVLLRRRVSGRRGWIIGSSRLRWVGRLGIGRCGGNWIAARTVGNGLRLRRVLRGVGRLGISGRWIRLLRIGRWGHRGRWIGRQVRLSLGSARLIWII